MLGLKPIVVSDSKRFIKKLERALNEVAAQMYRGKKDKGQRAATIPNLENCELPEDNAPESEDDRQLRIWTIHSENSGSEENIIFIREINTAIQSVDALLTTPSLGTGVDISTYHLM